MASPNARRVTATVARQILKETIHARDEELSRGLMAAVFSLADGRALVMYEHGRGNLYDSHDELVAWHRSRAAARREQSLDWDWGELLPQGQEFPAHVPELIGLLPERIGVKADALDLTEASLVHINRAVRRMGSSRVLTPEIFPGIVGYVGEVIRLAVNGRWEMTRGRQGWEPIIVDANDHGYKVLRIHKTIYEHGRTASVSAFARLAILHYQRFSEERR